MSARPALLAAPIAAALLLALTACSGPAAPPAPASAGAAKSATTASAAGTASTAASGGSAASSSGAITFTGAFAGTITIESCDGGQAILDVHYDGHPPDSSGAMTSKLFGINGPNNEQFIPSPLDQRPTVSGKTYTVKNLRLAGGKEVLTANGSASCP